MPKELTMTVKATELPIVKEYMEAIAAQLLALQERNALLEKVAEAAKSAIRCDLWGTHECSYECQGKNQSVCVALAAWEKVRDE